MLDNTPDPTRPFEYATRKVWIKASTEILEELRTGWSPPVQAHAEENADGSWEMTFRTYQDQHCGALDCPNPEPNV